jgi:transposase-like protein
MDILFNGVSARRYEDVLPEMAETVGASRSQVSRETIESGERLLKGLAERDPSRLELLAVWIDGIQLGPYHVIWAVRVDAHGNKHVLGLRERATENAAVAKARVEDLVGRGLDPKRRYLFVVDGAKARRGAIDTVIGADQPVQRCRDHKRRNTVGHLPEDQHVQAKAALRAAFKLDAKEGMAKLEQYASWLAPYPSTGAGTSSSPPRRPLPQGNSRWVPWGVNRIVQSSAEISRSLLDRVLVRHMPRSSLRDR